MVATTLSSNPHLQLTKSLNQHGPVIEEIPGLTRVYQDGHVERPQLVPNVSTATPPELNLSSCSDILIDNSTNTWARLYIPNSPTPTAKLPLIVYFHGGGFCVGSPAWSIYHNFLANLSSNTNSIIMSVNYRLAPEHPLPAAYEDALKSLIWLKQQSFTNFDFSRIFLAGDSAGANIAFHLTATTKPLNLKPLNLKGLILIQPFFGGEKRANSELHVKQPKGSALTLAASDTYWRLALPAGSTRDHVWSNPVGTGSVLRLHVDVMVCVAEMDVLRDRNLELCEKLEKGGTRIKRVVSEGVGHAFQVLGKSELAKVRREHLIACVNDFVHRK